MGDDAITRVLVTGARGFLGRHVLTALSGTSMQIHAVTSGTLPAAGPTEWHYANLLDVQQRRRLLAEVRPEALLHLAWTATPPDYWRDPANVQWTAATLELATTFAETGGRRFVGVGTCAEYAWRRGYCIEDSTPLAPATLYGTAKATCGRLLLAWARESGLSAAWARPFFLFGPADAPTRFIPSLVTELLAGRPGRCSAGSHVRDYLFVADAADALVAVLRSTITGPVNVGSGVPTRLGTLADGIASRLGRRDLLEIEPGPAEGDFVVARVARLQNEVGWRPRREFATALDTTVRWWADRANAGVMP